MWVYHELERVLELRSLTFVEKCDQLTTQACPHVSKLCGGTMYDVTAFYLSETSEAISIFAPSTY